MENREEIIQNVKKLITVNETRKALKLLLDAHFPGTEKSIILLKARLEKVTNQERLGIIDGEKANRERNQINYTLLSLLDDINDSAPSISNSVVGANPPTDAQTADISKRNKGRQSKKMVFVIGAVVLAVVAIVIIIGLNSWGLGGENSSNSPAPSSAIKYGVEYRIKELSNQRHLLPRHGECNGNQRVGEKTLEDGANIGWIFRSRGKNTGDPVKNNDMVMIENVGFPNKFMNTCGAGIEHPNCGAFKKLVSLEENPFLWIVEGKNDDDGFISEKEGITIRSGLNKSNYLGGCAGQLGTRETSHPKSALSWEIYKRP